MSAKSLTIAVPESLLKQLRARARQAKRSVESEVVSLLNDAISDEEQLPPDIEEAVARVSTLDDSSLRKTFKSVITPKQAMRLADLNYKAQAEGLTVAEQNEQAELLHIADKSMVVNAAILAELRKRGVDVSEFVAP